MEISIFQVDAFSEVLFSGNPAAVCLLPAWLADETMQAIAAENNLANTAFVVEKNSRYQLRWFTPACEVTLCGHATLASAFVLFHCLKVGSEKLIFDTKSGELSVSREGERLTLDFPAQAATQIAPSAGLIEAVGGMPVEILKGSDAVILVYETEAEVLALAPDPAALLKLQHRTFITTGPGTSSDFVSRFFAPAKGVPEDAVTGSAHTLLIPYWAKRLHKTELFARQVSKRGGQLLCKMDGERVKISGHAALYMSGTIHVPRTDVAQPAMDETPAYAG